MPRVKTSVASRKRRKRLLKLAKGFRGAKNRCFRLAKTPVMHSLAYSYRDRKARKRDIRKLWIIRINAAARENGLSYSRFINGLTEANIELNRKMLAHLAVTDKEAFSRLVEVAKSNVN
ncbi:MAG: 50S ribosomal protein L20 [bacterium]|nr:50S ribosomal protein L20 [bacterium]